MLPQSIAMETSQKPVASLPPQHQRTRSASVPGYRSKFAVVDFENEGYANPSYGGEREYSAYDASFKVEMAVTAEKDLLNPGSRDNGIGR